MNFQPYEALRRPVDKDLAALAALYRHNRRKREAKGIFYLVTGLAFFFVLSVVLALY